jgi:hypothetical protein
MLVWFDEANALNDPCVKCSGLGSTLRDQGNEHLVRFSLQQDLIAA